MLHSVQLVTLLIAATTTLATDDAAPAATTPAAAKGKGKSKGRGTTYRKHPNASQYSNFWRKAYSKGAQTDKRSIFMNWGYVPVDEPRCQRLSHGRGGQPH